MAEAMTDEELAAIEARANAAPDAPWTFVLALCAEVKRLQAERDALAVERDGLARDLGRANRRAHELLQHVSGSDRRLAWVQRVAADALRYGLEACEQLRAELRPEVLVFARAMEAQLRIAADATGELATVSDILDDLDGLFSGWCDAVAEGDTRRYTPLRRQAIREGAAALAIIVMRVARQCGALDVPTDTEATTR